MNGGDSVDDGDLLLHVGVMLHWEGDENVRVDQYVDVDDVDGADGVDDEDEDEDDWIRCGGRDLPSDLQLESIRCSLRQLLDVVDV